MYCYKRVDEGGSLLYLVTYNNTQTVSSNPLLIEISQEEYEALLVKIEAAYQPEEPDPDEISAEEALNILTGGASE